MKTKILPSVWNFLLLAFFIQSCGFAPGGAATPSTPTSVPFTPNNFEMVSSWNTIEIAPGIYKEGLGSAIVFSPDSKYLAVGASGGGVNIGGLGLWDVESGKQIRFFGQGLSNVKSVAFSPDGKILVAVDDPTGDNKVDNKIIFWDVESGNEIQTLTQQFAYIATFSQDGKTLAVTGGDDEELVLWDLANGKKTHVWSYADIPTLGFVQKLLNQFEI